MRNSQLASCYKAKVIFKSGKQTIEQTWGDHFVVCDGEFLTDWIIFYDHKCQWVRDGLFRFNKPIIRKLDELAIGHYSLVNGINKKLKGI
jgi:hypothetical protein